MLLQLLLLKARSLADDLMVIANSPLVEETVFKQTTTVRMTTRKDYDHLNRLNEIKSMPSLSRSLPPSAPLRLCGKPSPSGARFLQGRKMFPAKAQRRRGRVGGGNCFKNGGENTTGKGVPDVNLRFIYDGWNLVGEMDENDDLLRSYTWGLDLSGSEQGAGGVGGLVAVTLHTGGKAGTYFPGYDGNGNVMNLVGGNSGNVVAQYEYGPFGELLRATGLLSPDNPFLFSTK